MTYIVEYTNYQSKELSIVHEFKTWEEAIDCYNQINEALPLSELTRHCSCEEEVSHFDTRFNLFNELGLTLRPKL